jgi:hypothetical protein
MGTWKGFAEAEVVAKAGEGNPSLDLTTNMKLQIVEFAMVVVTAA